MTTIWQTAAEARLRVSKMIASLQMRSCAVHGLVRRIGLGPGVFRVASIFFAGANSTAGSRENPLAWIDPAGRDPLLWSAMFANEVQDTVRDDCRVDQEWQEVTPCPRLAEIADD